MKQLTIIIVTYNSEKDIYDCLSSVFQHNDIGENLEVIVVDNLSRDYNQMRDKIQQQYADKVTIVQNTCNGGYGQGNNVGIRLSHAPIIAIMNPDIRLIQPVFSGLLQCFEDNNVAMCAGKQYGSNMQPFTSFFSIFTLPWWFGRPLEVISRKMDHYFFRWEYLSGAFFLIRKDIFTQIGLFDENIFMYAEENDIHYRLSHMFPTMKIRYLKKLPYLHLAESREFSPTRSKTLYHSNGYFFRKNNFSDIKYWKGQIKLNMALIMWYNIFNHQNVSLRKELVDRNIILRALINQQQENCRI